MELDQLILTISVLTALLKLIDDPKYTPCFKSRILRLKFRLFTFCQCQFLKAQL